VGKFALISLTLLMSACATSQPGIDEKNAYLGLSQNLTDTDRLALASSAYRDSNYTRAISIYRQLINENQNNHKATLNLSAVYFDLALQGFKHVGGLIGNEQDAELARVHFNDIQLTVSNFMAVSEPYIIDNSATANGF